MTIGFIGAGNMAAAIIKGVCKKEIFNPGSGVIKDMVASPKGTTIEGIKVLEEHGVRAAFADAVIASCEKSKKM